MYIVSPDIILNSITNTHPTTAKAQPKKQSTNNFN